MSTSCVSAASLTEREYSEKTPSSTAKKSSPVRIGRSFGRSRAIGSTLHLHSLFILAHLHQCSRAVGLVVAGQNVWLGKIEEPARVARGEIDAAMAVRMA